MSMTTGADFSDFHRFAVDLRNARRDVVPRAQLAVRKVTLDIQRDARVFAPVDTGNLMNSITVEFSGSGTRFQGIVGPTAFYGLYVELGTSRMAPQPYMRPATDRHEDSFVRAMAQIGLEVLR